MYWLESFKRGDIEDVEYQRRIIDTLVNSVYVYDDGDKGRKLVLTFNISGNNTLTISSSDIERTAPPTTYIFIINELCEMTREVVKRLWWGWGALGSCGGCRGRGGGSLSASPGRCQSGGMAV